MYCYQICVWCHDEEISILRGTAGKDRAVRTSTAPRTIGTCPTKDAMHMRTSGGLAPGFELRGKMEKEVWNARGQVLRKMDGRFEIRDCRPMHITASSGYQRFNIAK